MLLLQDRKTLRKLMQRDDYHALRDTAILLGLIASTGYVATVCAIHPPGLYIQSPTSLPTGSTFRILFVDGCNEGGAPMWCSEETRGMAAWQRGGMVQYGPVLHH